MCQPNWNTSSTGHWSKDRELRYQHASEMRSELQRLKRDTEIRRAIASTSGTVTVAQESGSGIMQPTVPQPPSPASSSSPCACSTYVIERGEGCRSSSRGQETLEVSGSRRRATCRSCNRGNVLFPLTPDSAPPDGEGYQIGRAHV